MPSNHVPRSGEGDPKSEFAAATMSLISSMLQSDANMTEPLHMSQCTLNVLNVTLCALGKAHILASC